MQAFEGDQAHASFRDPDGYIVPCLHGPIRRILTPEGHGKSAQISSLRTIRELQARRQWVEATRADDDACSLIHPRIFFPSYPYEWPAAMLHRAASLTIQINRSLLDEGWELKDASPGNLLFEGPRPVFVDHLSPIRREPSQLGWRAYGQFVRTFLVPLLLHQKRHIPLKWMYLTHRDGISPELALSVLGPIQRFHPMAMELITLPSWVGKGSRQASRMQPSRFSDEVTLGASRMVLQRLTRHLDALARHSDKSSHWYHYQDFGVSYTPEGLAAKEGFVADALGACHAANVLDLGCNTGKFSKLAAGSGARVVALDSDPDCVNRLFIECESLGLDVQPLVIDFGRPSPPLGWNSGEEFSLLARCRDRFEMTLSLALVHHLLIRERIPLPSIAQFIALTTVRHAIVEWIPPEDSQFLRLSGPNHGLYQHLNIEHFSNAFAPWFKPLRKMEIPGGQRTLILLERIAQ